LTSGSSTYLDPGWYCVSVNIGAPSEDRESWNEFPGVLICVRCGSVIIAKHALSGRDLNDTERKFIFELSEDLADTFAAIEVQFWVLAPLAVAIQKLTIAAVVPNDEMRKLAATNSLFALVPGTVLDCRSNGNGMVYLAEGWALPEDIGTWSNGPRASLTAKVVGWPADDMILQISARPFLVRDRHPSLAVEVTANGAVVDRWSYRYPEDNAQVVRSARIPALLLAASPILQIELQIDEPAVPMAMGVHPTDDRQLGLFVSSVSFGAARHSDRRWATRIRSWFSSTVSAMRHAGCHPGISKPRRS
jgi:hypothetical protein